MIMGYIAMKRIFMIFALVLGCAALMSMPSTGFAQDEATDNKARLAVLDIDMIMTKSDAAKKIREKLDAKRAEYQKEVSGEEEDLRSQMEELSKQKTVLSEDEYDKKRNAFEKEVVSAQRDVHDRIKKLEASYAEAMTNLRKEVVKIVAEMSASEDIGMVLARNQVVLVDQSLDITEAVMKAVNEEITDIKVNLPE